MAPLPRSWRIARSGIVLRRDVDSADLRGGLAVAATSDESIEAGDERFDVYRKASMAVDQQALGFGTCDERRLQVAVHRCQVAMQRVQSYGRITFGHSSCTLPFSLSAVCAA